ncbi:hypothetical protein N7468_000270 [Penicillium chermesinum]|uniref:glutathione transferase n=1 Tax=Penicillium chermesinum TaxID=63820 RepID=A0A9W9PLA6_9EURO|nr:uncharacterized protein N7468_000270 [Penicillium chermesinum]KAJ5248819.1 hypothetical protein N7468_000270 [Penicillium chermesinum]KAJ6150920.1 hypothetical protein N7470_007514 [Penicillium chermesinum]
MSLKPITLWGHTTGANPWKVVLVLEELNLPYHINFLQLEDIKKPDFLSVNPNGRVPAIQDPNTGLTLWESGAIIEYLVDRYDKDHTLSFTKSTTEHYLAQQWLHFQMSGQGPYFGQAVWFKKYHSEQVQSAVDRYVKEIRRVSGVLDHVLADREYLVGGRLSYADLAFVPWYLVASWFEIDLAVEFPNLNAWLERLNGRPAVAKTMKLREEAIANSQ